MEVFISGVPASVDKVQLKTELAKALHTPEYSGHSNLPLNFEVFIIPLRRNQRSPTRCAKLTLPTVAVGERFLADYGGSRPRKSTKYGNRLKFALSNSSARLDIVEELRRTPYLDPKAVEAEKAAEHELQSLSVSIDTLQFGWECRDGKFSVEHELDCRNHCKLSFDVDRREFRISISVDIVTSIVVIHAAQLHSTFAAMDGSSAVLFFGLYHPPMFETAIRKDDLAADFSNLSLQEQIMRGLLSNHHPSEKRRRWSALDTSHAEVACYSSLAIQAVCPRSTDLNTYYSICAAANVTLTDFLYPVVRRGLFSSEVRTRYAVWLQNLPWDVAFQVEAMTRSWLVDLKEMLDLRVQIDAQIARHGTQHVVKLIRQFSTKAKAWLFETDDLPSNPVSISDLFQKCADEFDTSLHNQRKPFTSTTDIFFALHVILTPTTYRLEGPFPERSNRVMRTYPHNHDSFLRVSFVDETNLQFRFDREVDGRDFIRKRVGEVLADGLWIAGKHFKFLAYSQSALKEHSVWFVKEFITPDGDIVNASSIIESLGDFETKDPKLILCPARYGARISQAFTSTDASLSAEADEVFEDEDIEVRDIEDPTRLWNFTDGVGTISPEFAKAIWGDLRAKKRRNRHATTFPRAFQIRFGGSKGMLSVDHTLTGRAICLRPSMIKFEAPNARIVEIARAFDKPGPFYLNRPLITLLENLGVPFESFKNLQDTAVADAQGAVQSLARAAKLLETYGLGGSYRLTSVMLSLHKLGVGPLSGDIFWEQMMDFSIDHVLRELKHHARIPVADAWNVVGVADIHGFLEEGEVFVHIAPNNGEASVFLEDLVMVSRSPTIHPGDVQVVRAIGRPPPGSPFEKESLRNCIVFSTKGRRPLPSCLGGGDLDGDVYCCTMLRSLRPKQTYKPASYPPARRHLLDRPSTMQDVADFVVDYIYSDSLGIIAINWLIIADQSPEGIFDADCITLSALHNDAVDYPKSGVPVPLDKIPRLKFKQKPDWNAPETFVKKSARYYESQKAIGKLFRAIELPALRTVDRARREQSRRLRNGQLPLDTLLHDIQRALPIEDEDPIYLAVSLRVANFIRVGRYDEDIVGEIWELFEQYSSTLQTICADHTISTARNSMLTEEEAIVGTIVAKCSQPRKRKDTMSRLRDQTNELVRGVSHQLGGEEGTLLEKSLERAWVAYRIACVKDGSFGAKSFAWLALGEIFSVIKNIEESEGLF